MDIYNHPAIRGVAVADVAGSATIFSASSGGKWNVMNGTISFVNMTNSCTIALYEIDATNSAPIITFMSSATSGSIPFIVGPPGIVASATNSRFVLIIGTNSAAGSVGAVFSGYGTGG